MAEFGYVPQIFEGDKLPLDQVTFFTPFGSDDLGQIMEIMGKLYEEVPAMSAAWADYNQKVIAPGGADTYHLLSKFPIEKLSDLEGRKFGTSGLALNWLKGTGAIPVAGTLPTFYNSLETGLYEGITMFESGIAPYKFYEVAPYITKINFGAQYGIAVTVNLDTWNSMPADVQQVILEVGAEYRDLRTDAYVNSAARSMAKSVENGATITELPASERAALAVSLPNIAREWADALDAQGKPGTEVLEAYMRLSKEAGVEFARDWTVR